MALGRPGDGSSSLGWGVRTRTTRRADGDFAIDGDPVALEVARRSVVDRPWVWLRQVHGREVHVVAGAAAVEAVRGATAMRW